MSDGPDPFGRNVWSQPAPPLAQRYPASGSPSFGQSPATTSGWPGGPFDPVPPLAGAPGAAPAGPFGAGAPGPGTGSGLFGRPPIAWLLAAGAIGLAAAVVVILLGDGPVVSIVCWALCGPGGVGLLAVYSFRDTAQRARAVYTAEPWTRYLYAAAAVAVGIGIVACAIRVAQWAGRL